ncbi:MAG TPA: MASE1 domain-containing protein [Anaeromyxobacter sp.]|nr:MASE1 domain-containing protein [Anaeromyxobacter sp.]
MTEQEPTEVTAPLAARWRLPPWLLLTLFAAADFGLAHLGRLVTPDPTSFAAFWPAAGLVLGALLLTDRRRWPLVVGAAALPIAVFNVLTGLPLLLVATFAAGNVLEAVLGAWLATRLCQGRPRLSRLRDLIALMVAGPLIASPIATVPSALALWASAGSPFAYTCVRLWLGSALGTLAVAPVLLAWAEAASSRLGPGRAIEALGLGALFSGAAWLVFLAPASGFTFDAALFFPVLLWAVLRFGPLGTTLSGFALALLALFATVQGRGAFAEGSSPDANALSAQLFCAVTLFSILAMNSVVESRRLGAQALLRSRQELRLVRSTTDAASDLVACIDPSGTVVYANDAFCAAAGAGREAVVGRPLWELGWAASADDWAQRWDEVRARRTLTAELLVRSPGTEPLPVEIRASLLCFDGQEYCVSAGRSLRERRESEAALRMASVGTLAAGMAHEINNPLSYVLGNLTWLSGELARLHQAMAGGAAEERDAAETLASLRPVLEETTEGATRIRDVVRDLKLFSRSSEGPAVANVERALRAAITLAHNELRHRARVVLDLEEVPPVAGNEHRIGQVFLNLLVNAAQAIPDGRVDENLIQVRVRRHGPRELAVEVEDTGCGMSAEVLAHVFEPFFTTKAVGAGTGLGLSICHGIVVAMGGRIEVSSREGVGSLFRVILPASDAPPAPPAPGAGPPPRPAAGADRGRVLVVDDDPLVGRVVQRVLSEHEVVACTEPLPALRLAAEEPFDVVLCDLMMPAMSGMEFQERLARDRPRLAAELIFLTGGAFTPAALAFVERTANTRLDKPFDGEALRAEVARRLAGARRADEA